MQSTLETLGPLSRRLNVTVPITHIEGEIGKRLARLAKTVKVPGFRPGHVPMKMVAAQYGPQVRSDVISDAVQQSFNEAVREQKLRVAGYPRIEPVSDVKDDGALAFSAVFEIYPEFKVGDVSGAVDPVPRVAPLRAHPDQTLPSPRDRSVTTVASSRHQARARSSSPGSRGPSVSLT